VNTVIAPPSLDDADELAYVGALSFLESHQTSASPENISNYIQRTYTSEKFAADICNPQVKMLVARVEGTIAGYSKIIPECNVDGIEAAHPCKMERLYVLSQFLPLKIGQALFDENVKIAKTLAQSGMWLNVWTGNQRAIRFYHKQGFKKAGDTQFRISATHQNPNYLMWLHLQ